MSKRMDPRDEADEDDAEGGTPRWLAGTVMGVAFAGFLGLAYYAYHAGTRSIEEGELLVVEADANPVKEKPADPGGMQFPHQDKAIFEAIGGAPGKMAQVERVLPPPEEPLDKQQAAAVQAEGGKSWINEKLSVAPGGKEALIGKAPDAPAEATATAMVMSADSPAPTPSAPTPSALERKLAEAVNAAPSAGAAAAIPAVEVAQQAPPQAAPVPTPVPAPAPAPAPVVAAPPPEAKPAAPAEPAKVELTKGIPSSDGAKPAKVIQLKGAAEAQAQAEAKPPEPKTEAKAAAKPAAKAPVKPKASGGKGMVQLGAFRSEAEAQKTWNKMRGKFAELKTAQADIQRADLGERGVFYRLRINAAAPKSLCQGLTAKGQPCMVVN